MGLSKKRVCNGISAAVFSLALCLFIITLSIAVPIYCRGFYYEQIDALDITTSADAAKAEIKTAYDNVLDYLTKANKEFDTGVFKHSADGQAHFAACKKLFRLDTALLIISFLVIVILLILRKFKLLEPIKIGNRTCLLYSGIATVGITVIIGFFAVFCFDEAFIIFHKIAFPNQDNWVLSTRRDSIVKIFPEQFFFNCVLLIAAIIILLSLAAIIFDIIYSAKQKIQGDKYANFKA